MPYASDVMELREEEREFLKEEARAWLCQTGLKRGRLMVHCHTKTQSVEKMGFILNSVS
jgi:hypothetical protein